MCSDGVEHGHVWECSTLLDRLSGTTGHVARRLLGDSCKRTCSLCTASHAFRGRVLWGLRDEAVS